MLQKIYIIAVLILFGALKTFAQLDSISTTPSTSIRASKDSLRSQTVKGSVRISRDSVSSEVQYGARDSSHYDHLLRQFHLYGDAYIEYEQYRLEADYIVLDVKANLATAIGRRDSLGNWIGKPLFKDKNKSFAAAKMRFNFNTKKGMIYDVVTRENDIYVHGGRTKFIAENPKEDRDHDIIYNQDAIFTSCDNEVPHYGIRSTKQKVIPDELIVVGPSRMEIAGIPTPIWLPFGFFPVTKTQKQGILFPKDFEYSPQWGYGVRNVGYFMPLGQYANLQTKMDIYTRGAYRLNLTSQYKKNYKFTGSITLSYANLFSEDPRTAEIYRDKGWGINWSHSQDARAHPYQQFGGTIQIQSNNFQQRNYNDARTQLTNTYRSSLNYSRNFPGSPFSLTAGMTHSQNTNTRNMEVSLPNLRLKMTRINPFKRRSGIGPEKWYERITLNYDADVRNVIRTKDSLLFTRQTLDEAQLAFQHRISSGVNFKVFKYINFTPSIDYTETFNFRSIERFYDPTIILDSTMVNGELRVDTILGKIDQRTINDFTAFRNTSFRASMSTQLYGTMLFSKGILRGVRHVLRPNISFNWTPDNQESLAAFGRVIDSSGIPILDRPLEYNILDDSPFRAPRAQTGRSSVSYGLDNMFELKYYSKKDSTEKRLKIFDRFNVSGAYNIETDSFNFSPLRIGIVKRLFKGRTNITFNLNYDFYDRIAGVRQKELLWKNKKQLLRFDNARLTVNTSFKLSEFFGLFMSKDAYTGSFFSLFDRFNIRHNLVLRRSENREFVMFTDIVTNSVSTNGSIQLSPKWRLNIRQIGYDFKSKRVTYPDLGFVRDLHCWEMSITTQPIQGTYTFSIYVKPGTLGFLRIPYNRGQQDTRSRIF